MIPSAFVTLEALPLSPNGKIDRKALPDPGPGPLDPAAEYVARSPIEETLARVWAEVLELERVGVHDNFFDLGGHSLQSVQLVARLTAALGRPVSVKTVFQAPTIAAMAEVVERDAAVADRSQGDGDDPAALARRLLETEPPAMPPHVSIERRPFLSLFASGELAPVEAVAVSYFPSSLLQFLGLDRATVIHDWCGDRPVIADVRETPLGRIGTVMIPRFNDQLYLDRGDLLAVLGDAVRLAHRIGASTVSLTGLLPSATGNGRDLADAMAGHDLPRITTGHATTTSAVVLAVRRALEEGGRDLAGEHVGFIGLGSVGIATLRLLLSCLPHPARLSLCDVYSKRESLESLHRELVDVLGYRGEVRVLAAGHDVPAELYEASLIVGATNVAEVLDIGRLAPGTIVVDDSAPHAFASDAAMRRLRERADILVTEGGVLLAPEPLPLRAYVPDELAAVAPGGPGLARGADRSAAHHRLRPIRAALGQVPRADAHDRPGRRPDGARPLPDPRRPRIQGPGPPARRFADRRAGHLRVPRGMASVARALTTMGSQTGTAGTIRGFTIDGLDRVPAACLARRDRPVGPGGSDRRGDRRGPDRRDPARAGRESRAGRRCCPRRRSPRLCVARRRRGRPRRWR